MKLIFAGTPVFAECVLEALYEKGHDIVLVLTQPDSHAGRGMGLLSSPVKQRALLAGMKVYQPKTLDDGALAVLTRVVEEENIELIVVAAYGLILPQSVLNLAPCLNVHASLLPRWRGAAPIQRAILAGDTESGVSIVSMEAGLDTGPVYLKLSCVINKEDTAQSLHDRLAELGAQTLLEVLSCWPMSAEPQSEVGACYASKIHKQEARIDWQNDAQVIDRQIRAFDPKPGAYTQHKGDLVKIWQAQPVQPTRSDQMTPGQIIQVDSEGMLIFCGQGALLVKSMQHQNACRVTAEEWAKSRRLEPTQSSVFI